MHYKIIDCHTHVYPDKIAAKAVDSIGKFYDIPMAMDGTVGTLVRTAEEAGVEKCLIHSAAVDGAHVRTINDYIASVVHAHPDRLMGFATLHPDLENPGEELEHAMEQGLLGVKLHPDMQKFALDDPRTDKLYDVCEGMCPMLLHTGDKRYHYSNPSQIPPILARHPHLTLICAHMGGYSEWESAAAALADTNVYVDCSSSFFGMPLERMAELFQLYGDERVLFGSDYPMWNMKNEIANVLSLRLSEESNRKIFSENLLRLLGMNT